MNIHSKLADLKKLNLPVDEFVIVSSGALAIRDIREARDLDIIVTAHLWEELAKHYPVTKNDWGIERLVVDPDIEILHPGQSIFGNSKVVPFQEIFDKADIFEGVKFMNLDHLKMIKAKLGRDVDVRDIKLIDEYLAKQKGI